MRWRQHNSEEDAKAFIAGMVVLILLVIWGISVIVGEAIMMKILAGFVILVIGGLLLFLVANAFVEFE